MIPFYGTGEPASLRSHGNSFPAPLTHTQRAVCFANHSPARIYSPIVISARGGAQHRPLYSEHEANTHTHTQWGSMPVRLDSSSIGVAAGSELIETRLEPLSIP